MRVTVFVSGCTNHCKYRDNIILLENPVFSDESQEFDHIVVVGPQRIFNIETKNCSGKTLH